MVTGHRGLIWFDQLKDVTVGTRFARWKICLQEYDYKIVYKPGRAYANAHALACNPVIKDFKKSTEKRFSKIMRTVEIGSCNLGNKDEYHEYPIKRIF